MSTLTKQWLQQKIAEMEAARDEIPFGLDEDDSNTLAALRIALASLEAEPVCVIDQSNLDYLKSGSDADVWPASRTEMGDVLLYRAAPPAPVVPDEATPDNIQILASTYAPRGVTYQWDRDECNAAADSWNACRAAMLQSFGNSEQLEPVMTAYKLPFDQWLSQQTGTIDVECGCVMTEVFFHWLRVAYEAGNSPVIPDGWVMVPFEPTAEMISSGITAHFERSQIQIHDRPAPGPMECAYVAMLSAAPQQEVK
ncbi:TPA: hypothetical protein R4X89_002066 [Enterobacter hormaechei subsp. steigerwaltii]|uniref:hypothetical protein n=1 Tax=Enterobacter hormaechei TaxID=158836 RepID=UPI00190F6952|nr:hypothetical protein [Enterobacter hormaechei]MBT1855858.1 hypothetical protein [Enterobacter hormaechei subsp. xiangfangensis]HED2220749.1 hypothetical protein [Enterobacter hormaechei subsp. steigerwaltii]ELB7319316.1 hypothetical protein [Enterobacter hormaechei]ELN4164213.1 hypothetical protein [Enterobacter hormaechei]HED2278477.1 hypothetical protein [Enterobacter hormaechei subsp. steigerwaltii]